MTGVSLERPKTWAELILVGEKSMRFRSPRTKYRGRHTRLACTDHRTSVRINHVTRLSTILIKMHVTIGK